MDVNGKNTSTLKLYTNLNDVTRVKKIDTLDYVGYKKKRFNIEIAIMKSR